MIVLLSVAAVGSLTYFFFFTPWWIKAGLRSGWQFPLSGHWSLLTYCFHRQIRSHLGRYLCPCTKVFRYLFLCHPSCPPKNVTGQPRAQNAQQTAQPRSIDRCRPLSVVCSAPAAGYWTLVERGAGHQCFSFAKRGCGTTAQLRTGPRYTKTLSHTWGGVVCWPLY
ncbi:hypothetical protein BD289DRAFT_435513, partial [Coniella lustricola]